ncbi:eukaryotic translation initiation factor 5B isoform X2 [Halyomorpha halys]|uniref:eukaryotic translation initiation factor 5B isoform X2 n=1 Tax=Halyomorpha halys TaxID=286706 RepID=UPI0006D4FC04
MGKAKKGRKVECDDDTEPSGVEKEVENDVATSKSKTKKEKKAVDLDSDVEEDTSKKKKNKKLGKIHDEADDLADEVQELSLNSKGKKDKKKGKNVQDSDEERPKKAPPKKGKKHGSDSSDGEDEPVTTKTEKKKGGFALLAMSDEDVDKSDDDVDEDDEGEVEEVEIKPEVKKEKEKDKKGGKKPKKKKKDDDEDLDKILAELEMEYAGIPVPKTEEPPVEEKEVEKDKKGKKKKKGEEDKKESEDGLLEDKPQNQKDVPDLKEEVIEDDEKTTKSQKKKEKKQKQKEKATLKEVEPPAPAKVETVKPEKAPEPEKPEPEAEAGEVDADDDDDKKKKKKKKGKGEKEDKDKGGKPNKKTIAAMQEALRKIKEEEERLAIIAAEKLKKEEEAERARQEQIRLEIERKERKKQKEKERKERLKAEGKLLNQKQKADRARAEAMIEAMKAMYAGSTTPHPPAKPRPFTKLKKNKKEDAAATEEVPKVQVEIIEPPKAAKEEEASPPKEEEDVKDSWDVESDEEDKSEETSQPKEVVKKVEPAPVVKKKEEVVEKEESEDEDDDDEEDESSGSDETSSDSDSEDEKKKTDADRRREKALERIRKRQEDAEKAKSPDELRAAVVCVLGHVDTGKTKILDKLRRTNVQDSEAGGITQQIGATNVPIEAIKEQAKIVKGFNTNELRIPGLLIIDTPGHESFSNLRSRGSSLCDIAILVVDIMHGLEPQTIESLNLLKQRKTPFIVALNKIDRLYDWQTMLRKDVRDVIKGQAANTQLEFEQRSNEVILQFAEQGLNAALFYNNPDVRSYVSLVPTSAITGEGMGNLLALIVESCQNMLAKRLMFSPELQATVLEVKAIPGLGTTIDVILVNGYLREGETVVLAGTDAPIVTQIRSLLMPQPLKELRVKNAYVEYKEIKAAQGVKIAAKDLEKVIAGLNLRVAEKPDEVEILKEEVARELKSALSSIKLQERGVYVQASTLGSLEALLEFLRTSSIPYSNIRIGPVVKKDVMKASIMLEHDSQYAVILAFDVKIERDAQELADNLGVKIFQADIIYHLFDKFMAFREELKAKKREEFKSIAVFPCKLKILPQFVFNSRDPIVCGVIVEAGIVKEGTPICVPSKEFVELGIVTSIENNHKPVESARKGQEVCIKIEPIPGESPKMFGRHFDEKDFLISKISRQSIDACKDYFRDDLVKTDWQLMVELKKLFQIL